VICQTVAPPDYFLGCGKEGIYYVLLYIIAMLQPSLLIILLSHRENGAYDCGDSNRWHHILIWYYGIHFQIIF